MTFREARVAASGNRQACCGRIGTSKSGSIHSPSDLARAAGRKCKPGTTRLMSRHGCPVWWSGTYTY